MKNLLLSNINIHSLLRKLDKEYEFDTSDGYNGWISYIYTKLDLSVVEYNNVFILLDGYELKKEVNFEMINSLFNKISGIAKINVATKFWISDIHILCKEINESSINDNYEFSFKYNQLLNSIVIENKNIYKFPLREAVEEIGAKQFYSSKMWYLASIKYSSVGETTVQQEIDRIINVIKRKKCLILDMDNTLWGGVIGEIGFENIDVSERFQDFQRRIREIKDKGIILAIVTKNNYSDAITAFQNKSMVLDQDDFIQICANWNNKADNILNIVKALNIGLDAVVFIDDNPVERENIKLNLPMVSVPEFPKDTSMLNNFAIELYKDFFYNPKPVEEDNKKTSMYRDNIKRDELRIEYKDISDYIRQLKIIINFRIAKNTDIPRICDLSRKTNQYNTSSQRYSEKELSMILKDSNYKLYIAEVSDRIGDSGLCIVCIIKIENDIAVIENFFMSCRIMGRKIEHAFLDHVMDKLYNDGIQTIIGLYIKTERNVPAKELFTDNNFTETVISDMKSEFKLKVNQWKIASKGLIEVEENEY